ncbi:MAG: glycoside hydrolase family 5 protein [Planctomycetaceae bacterium]|jgi:aryl-phospho-beta-D-glucosidase BglC (GH1 family)|nr:glycoside hydrolase family 5 protein [Planctomycetaceae bacterium]
MQRRDVLKLGLASGLAGLSSFSSDFSSGVHAEEKKLLKDASYNQLPQWRGFNLLEKSNGRNARLVEDDFRWISDFGFNFVRLPMDYRTWIKDNDWHKIDEKVIEEIVDEAIRFGEKYGIHVNINFHRAPGYTVTRPAEPKKVWTDTEALDVCLLHWQTFAKRYKGISNDLVSFNLFNEPDRIEPILDQCVAVHKALIKGIREEDPNRLIICDGYEWGTKPFTDLVDQKVAQATRGYIPSQISFHKSKTFPVPTWPLILGNGLLYSDTKGGVKKEFRGALVISGLFPNQTKLRMKVDTVSNATKFVVLADGKTIFEHQFKPAAGEGEWKTVVFRKEWNIYQNIYDRDYETTIPAGTQKLEFRATQGDWLTLKQIAVWSENLKKETAVNLYSNGQLPPPKFQYRESEQNAEFVGSDIIKDKTWLRNHLEPWKKLQEQGCGVMVGEFGTFASCPHDVVLSWMSDCLANWREAGWGYALWEFRGGMGVMDSQRPDVDYENFHGHKLDRKMLKLLQGNS